MHIEKPVAILSDVHGNSPALKTVLKAIDSAGVETVFVLGDLINAIDPLGCCDLLRSRPHTFFIKGNAEEYVCTEDIDEFPWNNREGWEWIQPRMRWLRDTIGSDHLEWIRSWPEELVVNDALMVHDSPVDRLEASTGPPELDPKYYRLYNHGKGIGTGSSPEFIEQNINELHRRGVSLMFCGHTHGPVMYETEDIDIFNVGSCGMALDRDPRACWVLWREHTIEVHREAYDIDASISLIDELEQPNQTHSSDHYKKMIRYARHWRWFI